MIVQQLLAKLVLVASMLSLTNCMVWRYGITPPVVGRVVSTKSDAPIQGAKVGIKDYDKTATLANSKGEFSVPGTYRWAFCPIIPGDWWPRGLLIVEAQGYQIYSKQVGILGNRTINLKEPIKLHPVDSKIK